VRFSAEIRKSVVFIGLETGGLFLPVGTGFLGIYRHRDLSFAFLVTADHVLEMIQSDVFSVRLNRRNGDAESLRLSKTDRIPVLDYRNDIAMVRMQGIHDDYDVQYIDLNDELRKQELDKVSGPTVGDEVFTIGLYTSHYGQIKNIPVVRVGNIAMIPEEPVQTQRGFIDAYLVETRSIAGLSGSPVYLNIFPILHGKEGVSILQNQGHSIIGIMVGYHIISTAEDQISVPSTQGGDTVVEYSLDERNTGFAIVVPIERVYEILKSELVLKMLDFDVDSFLNSARHLATTSGSKILHYENGFRIAGQS
jgi:hypothetical protein